MQKSERRLQGLGAAHQLFAIGIRVKANMTGIFPVVRCSRNGYQTRMICYSGFFVEPAAVNTTLRLLYSHGCMEVEGKIHGSRPFQDMANRRS